MNYSWCDETPFPLGKTKRVPRELALALRGGIQSPVCQALGLGKSTHSLAADDIPAFVPR